MRRVKLLLVGLVFGGLILWGGLVPSATSQAQGSVSHLNTNRISVIDGGARLAVIEYNRHGPPYRFEIVDATTLAVVEAVALDVEGEILGISANGEWVVYRRSTGGHAVLNWITGEDDTLTPGGPIPISEASITWNPVDGRIMHGEGAAGLISSAIYGPDVLPAGGIFNEDNPGMSSASWSNDGTRLATTGSAHISIWEPEQLTSVSLSPALQFPGTGIELTWDPTDRYLGGRTNDCEIVIYSVADGSLFREFQCPTETYLYSIAWSPDGTQIAAGHMEGIYVWDVTTGELVHSYTSSRLVGSMVWLPIGLVHNSDQPGLYLDGFPVTEPLLFDPPTASAGPDQTLSDTDNSGSELVTLDGSASSDPNGTIVDYLWVENGAIIASGATPTLDLAVGVHTIYLTVTDNDGEEVSAMVTITIEAAP